MTKCGKKLFATAGIWTRVTRLAIWCPRPNWTTVASLLKKKILLILTVSLFHMQYFSEKLQDKIENFIYLITDYWLKLNCFNHEIHIFNVREIFLSLIGNSNDHDNCWIASTFRDIVIFNFFHNYCDGYNAASFTFWCINCNVVIQDINSIHTLVTYCIWYCRTWRDEKQLIFAVLS